MLYDDLLIYCARKGCPELLRKSAFRKYCRRNRGAVAHVLTKEGFVIKTVIGDSVDNVICVYGVYEEPTTRVIKALAKKCDSFIDVGCNIGYYSCLFGMQHPAARLFGIDLNPEMINRTRENLKLNNLENVTLLAIGAGASKCKMTLNIPEDRHSLSSLAYVPQRSNKVNIRTLQVDIEPLGNIIAQHEISKALLKIDAEGFEYQVFSGLSEQSIQSIQFIILSFLYEHWFKLFNFLPSLMQL